MAVQSSHSDAVAGLILDYVPKALLSKILNFLNSKAQSILHLAAKNGHYGIVKKILDIDDSVKNSGDIYEYAPLHYAVMAKSEDTTKLLISK